jgi:hypothetical protein
VGLRTPAAGKALAYFFAALQRVEYPGAGLPGWLVAQVLGVAAGQLDNPLLLGVQVEAEDAGDRWSVPSVRVLFAFGQILV